MLLLITCRGFLLPSVEHVMHTRRLQCDEYRFLMPHSATIEV
jgi:hypothetical protein